MLLCITPSRGNIKKIPIKFCSLTVIKKKCCGIPFFFFHEMSSILI